LLDEKSMENTKESNINTKYPSVVDLRNKSKKKDSAVWAFGVFGWWAVNERL